MTSTRFTPGATSLSSASRLPPIAGSQLLNPVALPPGRARLPTMLVSTGSPMLANTIGMVRVCRCNSCTNGVVVAHSRSGFDATSSAAAARIRSIPPLAIPRNSIRRLRPSVQPNSRKPRTKAERRACATGSLSAKAIRTPIRRTRSPCCAHAASGHTAALPSPAMNSRRFIE